MNLESALDGWKPKAGQHRAGSPHVVNSVNSNRRQMATARNGAESPGYRRTTASGSGDTSRVPQVIPNVRIELVWHEPRVGVVATGGGEALSFRSGLTGKSASP